VHACLKHGITATEALQATASLNVLLQNGDVVTIKRKDTPTRQTAKTTSYDNTRLQLFTI